MLRIVLLLAAVASSGSEPLFGQTQGTSVALTAPDGRVAELRRDIKAAVAREDYEAAEALTEQAAISELAALENIETRLEQAIAAEEKSQSTEADVAVALERVRWMMNHTGAHGEVLAGLKAREAELQTNSSADVSMLTAFRTGEQFCGGGPPPPTRRKHVAFMVVGSAFRAKRRGQAGYSEACLAKIKAEYLKPGVITTDEWLQAGYMEAPPMSDEHNWLHVFGSLSAECTQWTYDAQKAWVQAQVERGIVPLEKSGHTVTVFLSLYEQSGCAREWMEELPKWYGGMNGSRAVVVRNSTDGDQWENRMNSFRFLREHTRSAASAASAAAAGGGFGFDFVTMTRYDLLPLKSPSKSEWRPGDQELQLLHISYNDDQVSL